MLSLTHLFLYRPWYICLFLRPKFLFCVGEAKIVVWWVAYL